jgi:hypothetical protein
LGLVGGGPGRLAADRWGNRQTDDAIIELPDWRDDPATGKQKKFARDLHIKFPANITKGELSDLIDQQLGKPPAEERFP